MIVKRNYAEANYIEMLRKRIVKCEAPKEDSEEEYLKTFSQVIFDLVKGFAEAT
jgi:hypothetical protein